MSRCGPIADMFACANGAPAFQERAPRDRKHIETADGGLGPFDAIWRLPLAAATDIDVWLLPRGGDWPLAGFSRILDQQDWAVFERVRDPADRQQLMATRIALRFALTHLTQGAVSPDVWRLQSTSYGKPRVANGLPPAHFSVSHTHSMSVIAASARTPVGIDIEAAFATADDSLIAAVCSARERRSLLRVPEDRRQRAFARLWTLKEAYSKLTGTGLATDFKSLVFPVETEPHAAGPVVEHRARGARFLSWSKGTTAGPYQISVAFEEGRTAAPGAQLTCLAPSKSAIGLQTVDRGRLPET